MDRKIYITAFFLLLILFSIGYWSFFPGAYTYDSYFSYLNSLGITEYREVVAPIHVLFWKIVNNYNFGPLLINYLIFIAALFLSIKFTKEYRFAVFSLIGICLPYTLLTFIFAWKDPCLLSIMFLTTVMLLNKKQSTFYTAITIFLFFIAFTLRLNAVFAIVPLLYYFLSRKHTKLRAGLLTIALIISFQIVNKGINVFIFKAEYGNGPQAMMFTDIAKINHLQGRNVVEDIPEEFVIASNLGEENVNNMFDNYCKLYCNDVFYIHPDQPNAKKFLIYREDLTIADKLEAAAVKLRNNWLKKIISNPVSYLRVRYDQLQGALWSESLLYGHDLLTFNDQIFESVDSVFASANGRVAKQNFKDFGRQNKIFYPSTNPFIVSVRGLIAERTSFADLISYPGLYFILSVLMLILFSLNRKRNDFYRLGVYVSFSGVIYTLAYLFILPCTDYRYFLWTVFSFWISAGILALALNIKENSQLPENNAQVIE